MAPRSSQSSGADPRPCAERILARRGHGREELRRKLVRRGFDPAAVEALLQNLAEQGVLDDAAYVREYARQALDKGHGSSYIRAKLASRGLRCTGPVCTAGEESASLRAFLERRRLRPSALTGPAERAKMQRFLSGRGYSAAAVQSVLGQESVECD